MTHPLINKSKLEIKEFYSKHLASFLEETYYYPRLIVAAESKAGKSTLISRMSTIDMRDFLKLEIGHIRTTACTAQHVFDPHLPKNIFAVSAKKKFFGEIRDKVTAISITEFASNLILYAKDNDYLLDELVETIFDNIFIRNKSLFDLSEILDEISQTIIKEQLAIILKKFINDDYVKIARVAKENFKSKSKDRTLKSFVEDELSQNIGLGKDELINKAFDRIFGILKQTINDRIIEVFDGTNDRILYSVFNIEEDNEDGIKFMEAIFGSSTESNNKKTKGIQYFLDEIIVHVPTNEIYDRDKPFVVLDTQGLDHENNQNDEILSNFLTLVNSNRVNQILFLSPFSTDDKVFGVVRSGLNKIKKKIGVTLLLTKYDEFISSAIVSSGKDTDELDDDLLNEFVKTNISPQADNAIKEIKKSIERHNLATDLITFDESVYKLSFQRSFGCSQTKISDIYNIINNILDKIESDTTTRIVKRVDGIAGDIDEIVPVIIDHDRLYSICKNIIDNNVFLNSLNGLINKKPHWTSVYELKYKIKIGHGHTTNARSYDNFSIYPAAGIRNSLISSNISNVLSWDFSNLQSAPDDLERVLRDNIESELVDNVYQLIARNMTYEYITDYFYRYQHYLDWYQGLMGLYKKIISDPDCWVAGILSKLTSLAKVKVRETLSVN
ncbi:hypothetical protein ACFSO7_01285 [Bacillus sp. CGMCC 1.16607]|uniref:hypothetical protein n=1 Tax=Bacillus sp. CGMCC 1.16607 TaxID=3351842 RepID=UPI00362732E0